MRTVCGCIVVRFDKNDTKILLVSEDGIQWGIPKGGAESGEDFECAAIRETFEETAIKVRTVGFFGTFGKLFVWFAIPLDRSKEPVPQAGEIQKACYHSIDDMPSIDFRQVELISTVVDRLRLASKF